ncbi:hypothetical protein BDV93DRAFT_554108 [Ceratobasidium sp. AG-I]|nr:hypothetical protein BDV93DRAFT_554108 [Ceratobasidium sp. AG-I]
MNLRCGIDNITHDGDYKHEQKCFASALRNSSGFFVGNTHLNVGINQQNILLLGVTLELVELLFNGTDPQNVPKANRLLALIHDASQLDSITSSEDQRAFVLLGKLMGSFAQAFTDMELALSQQFVLPSQTGHLMFALFSHSKTSFTPGQLYYNVQATIKNAFCLGGKAGIDHTNPRSWRGNVTVRNVRLSSAWIQGHDQAAQALSKASVASTFELHTLHLEHEDIDLMRPLGTYVGLQEDSKPAIHAVLSSSTAETTAIVSGGANIGASCALQPFLDSNKPADQVEPFWDSETSIQLEFMLDQPSEPLFDQTTSKIPPKKGWLKFENKWIHMETTVKHYIGPTGPSAQDILDVESDFVLGQLALTFVSASGFFAASIIHVTSIALSGGENRRGISYDQLKDPGVIIRGQILVLKQDYESLNWVWQREQAWETLGLVLNKRVAPHEHEFATAEAAVSDSRNGSSSQEIWSFDDESLQELALNCWALLLTKHSRFPVRMATQTFPYRAIKGPAGKIHKKKPTSNRPIKCEACVGVTPDQLHNNNHVYWSYNMPQHLRVMHPEVQDGGSAPFWQLFKVTQEERRLLGVSSNVSVAPQKYIIHTAVPKGKARAT